MDGIHLDFQEKSFVWALYNCPMLPYSKDEPLCSPEFSIDSLGQGRFYLQLHAKRSSGRDNEDYVSIYIARCSSDYGPKNVLLKYEISVLCDQQQPTKYSYSATKTFQRKTICGRCHFMTRDELLKFKKLFFIKCHYSLADHCENPSPWSSSLKDLECLSRDLKKYLDEAQHCDLSLRTADGILLKAHKAVIKCRCPNLLKSTNTKANSGKIKVAAQSSDLSFLLRYLYSGKVDFEETKSIDYDALNQFDIPHLRQLLFPMLPAKFARTAVREKRACFCWPVPKMKLTKGAKLTKAFCLDESLDWTKIKVSLDVEQELLDQASIKFCVRALTRGECIHMTCKVYLIDSKNAVEYEHDFDEKGICILTYPLNKVLPSNSIFSKNGILEIFFEFGLSDGQHTSEVAIYQTPEMEEDQTASSFWMLQEDLKQLYKNRGEGDVIITVENKKWPVHKVILSARSPVFSKMFEHNMIEKLTGKVAIADLKEPVFAAMMSYMYCGKLDTEPEDISSAFDLYVASDKYEILQLKEKCVGYFNRVLDIGTLGAFLRFANVYTDECIQVLLKQYIVSNINEILGSEELRKTAREKLISHGDLFIIQSTAKQSGTSVLMTMLSCLYCDELNGDPQNIDSVIELCNIAYSCRIEYLMEQCVLFFDKIIKPSNVGKFFVEADRNRNAALKSYVDNFVCSNAKKIVKSGEWEKIMQEHVNFRTDMEKISLDAGRMDSSIVNNLLFIIFTGRLESDLNSLLNLYFEAGKHQLNQLKEGCTYQVNLMISEENMGFILSISDKYNDDVLKKCVENFVSLNADKILESSEWKKKVRTKWDVSDENSFHQNISIAAKEVGYSIVMTMLYLIYCGKMNVNQEDVDYIMKLYEIAVKYSLIPLKEECIFLIRTKFRATQY